MDTTQIRQQIAHEVFDYQTLVDCLREYDQPRDKITRLLKRKGIIRVKKGLYVFGENLRREPVSREILANLIYGPSYLSLEYALQFHGMIPERVQEVTSVTTGRSRRFDTPLGVFSYRRISMKAFRIGMDRVELSGGSSFLIATPEKALLDKLNAEWGAGLKTQQDVRAYVLDNLRIEPDVLAQLDPDALDEYSDNARSRRGRLLAAVVRQLMMAEERGV